MHLPPARSKGNAMHGGSGGGEGKRVQVSFTPPGFLHVRHPTGGSLRFTPGYLSGAPPGQNRITSLHADPLGKRHIVCLMASPCRGITALAGPEGRQIDSPGRQPGV